MTTTGIRPLIGPNYEEWVVPAKAYLSGLGYRSVLSGKERPLLKPTPPASAATTEANAKEEVDPYQLESSDPAYMVLSYRNYRELQQYEITLEKASGAIPGLLSPALQRKYYDKKWDSNPKELWDAIRMDRERIFKVDGRQLIDKLGSIKFADFASSEDFYMEIQRVASQLKIVDVDIDDPMLGYYMTKALPTTPEWDQFTTMLNMTKQDKKPEDVYIALEAHEAKLQAKHAIPPDTALFAKGGTRYNTSGKTHGYGKTNTGKEGSDSTSKKGKKSPVVCYGCGKQGHMKKECRSCHLWKENQSGQATANAVGPPSRGTETDDLILTIAETSEVDEVKVSIPQDQEDNTWIVDSGASVHVTEVISIFVKYQKLKPGERSVKVANDRYVSVTGIGDIAVAFSETDRHIFRNVLHVTKFGRFSLLSLFKLLSDGYKVEFGLDTTRLLHRGNIVASRLVTNGLFYLTATAHAVNPAPAVFAILDNEAIKTAMLWHNRLGHLGLRVVKKLQRYTEGMQLPKGIPDTCLCEACILGKLCRLPFVTVDPEKRSKRPFELIHSDVVGPFRTPSQSGKRYMVVFTDDCTRWSEVYFMSTKSEVRAMFEQFFQLIQNQKNRRIGKLRTDGGGEYSSNHFLSFLASDGMVRQVTAPYSHVSNGIAERTNRGILDPVHCMLKHSGLPNSFWAEAARVAVYIKNRATHRSIGKTPYEELHGRKPEIGHLRSFGCLAYTHVPTAKRTKLDDRATRYIFIGYTETPSIWRVYDPTTNRVYMSRDVKFDEATFYKDVLQESVGVQVQLFPP